MDAAIVRALDHAARSVTEATRELLLELFDGRRLAEEQQSALSAIAERATTMHFGTAPVSAGVAAEALGDNWFQCPHCAEVFEGEAAACKACGKLLAAARRALVIELGGATLWLCARPDDGRPSGALVQRVEWMRVQAGARWFELFDEAARTAAGEMLTMLIPPNVSAVGARDGDRTLLVHPTKFEVHVVERGVHRADGDKKSATELAVRELTEVLYPDDAPEAPSGTAIAGKGHARNPELEAAIASEPDRPDAYLVLADWLQVQGDPRGKLIVLQHANEQIAIDRLLAKHAHHFFGRLAPAQHLLERHSAYARGRNTAWRWGYLESLWISNKRDGEHVELEIDEALAAMLDHPSCLFLRELTVGIVEYEDNSYDGIARVIGARELPALRSLILGDFHSEETELNWSHTGDLSPMYRAMPNLRSLTVRSGSIEPGRIALPNLESLTIITGGLDDKGFSQVCAASWPNLTRLSMQLGSAYGFTAEHLEPILDAEAFPRVVHLGLGNSSISDQIAEAIPRSKIAAQLVSLDLSLGTLGDAGALALAAGHFPKLEKIDVTRCYLSAEGIAALSRIAKHVEAGDQRDDDGDPADRYIAAFE